MPASEPGTMTCVHVAKAGAADDEDGSWQHLCELDHEPDESGFVIVGIEHLVARQPELQRLKQLEPGWIAQRSSSGAWTRHRA